MTSDAIDRARSALALANAEPARARDMAEEVLEESGALASVRAIAGRALALAYANLLEVTRAVDAIAAAVDEARQSRDEGLIGECLMTSAGVASWAGENARAAEEMESAIDVLSGLAKARAEVQCTSVYYRLGRFKEALLLAQRAEPVLVAEDDRAWLGHLAANRALALAYMGATSDAEEHCGRARQLFHEVGYTALAARMVQNLGWLSAQRGDLPGALAYFDEAEAELAAIDAPVGEVLRDRADALLLGHLADEAYEAAYRSSNELLRNEMRAGYAEALLRLATAALMGHHEDAEQVALRAQAEFETQERSTFALMALGIVLRARLAAGASLPSDVDTAASASRRLAEAGAVALAVRLQMLAARIALEFEDAPRARLLAAEVRLGAHTPVDVELEVALCRALIRALDGNRRGALAHVRSGLRRLVEVQASIGSTDARAHVSRHGADLRQLGMRLASEGRRARQVFEWSERCRATSLLLPRVRPPRDGALRSALEELRARQRELEQLSPSDPRSAELETLVIRAERRVAATVRRSRGESGITDRVNTGELVAGLGGTSLVSFIAMRDRLAAVRVVDGRVSLHDLGPEGALHLDIDGLRLGLPLRARAQAAQRSSAAADISIESGTVGLRAKLMDPLRIPDGPLIVVAPPSLLSIPWLLVRGADRGSVTVAPSASSWFAAAAAKPAGGGCAAVSGPDLTWSDTEVSLVGEVHRSARVFDSEASAVADVLRSIDGIGIAHFATHGRFKHESPMFSALQVADGPLTLYDIEQLEHAPSTVILSSCDVGRSSPRGDSETVGMVSGFLGIGAQSIIASVEPLADIEELPHLMAAVHRLIVSGERPAEALRLAAMHDDPAELSASFVCFGAG